MKHNNLYSFYYDFFGYNHQINLRLANSFEANLDLFSPKIIRLACHIQNAHSIWNARLEGISDPCKPWDLFLLKEFAQKEKQNYQATLKILELVDLDEQISYSNSMGKKFVSLRRDILTHIVNHATYHRGQIAMLMRESDLEPITSDYIFFKSQI